MKTKKKKKLLHKLSLLVVIIAAVALAFLISGRRKPVEEPPVDPHEGLVHAYNGFGYTWILPAEGMPVNPFTEDDFDHDENGVPSYNGSDYATFRGIDVSEHQGDIDWNAVKESGIDFAIIRIGGRGYGKSGKLLVDEKFADNLAGAKAAGLKVGVYFFSQAENDTEAVAEAELAVWLLDGAQLDLPVFYDWEHIETDTARTKGMNGRAITDCAVAFCEAVEKAGYEAGIYANVDMSYYSYDLSRLAQYDCWCAAPGDYPYSYYAASIWQYSFTGKVPGIEYDCDMDMLFVKYE